MSICRPFLKFVEMSREWLRKGYLPICPDNVFINRRNGVDLEPRTSDDLLRVSSDALDSGQMM
jgi:hypothetical protein